jgi:hypothetical protein
VFVQVRTVIPLGVGLVLLERITGRVAELTGQVERLRKQLADAEYELERLVVAEQVVARLLAEHGTEPDEVSAEVSGQVGGQRGFAVLVPYRGDAAGAADLPADYRVLVEAVAAAAAEVGGPVACAVVAERAGLDISGRRSEAVRAKLRRLEDRGWLRRSPTGHYSPAP